MRRQQEVVERFARGAISGGGEPAIRPAQREDLFVRRPAPVLEQLVHEGRTFAELDEEARG